MSRFSDVTISAGDSPSVDAFGRWRVSNPTTLFDSKQISDNLPLFWDDQEESGSGTTSSHSANKAATTIGVATGTAGKRTRQTFMRFNYQPGKSQLIKMTGVLSSAPTSGVKSSMGYFDDNNGLFLTMDGTTAKFVIRSNVTGTPVDTEIPQTGVNGWNHDKFDGTGPSGITLDFTKTQIFYVDFEWLGVGSVVFGFVLDRKFYVAHRQDHANSLAVVYMSTPNLPLRYQIENDGTGAGTTMDHICSTVESEGGSQLIGSLHHHSTEGTHIDANMADTHYAILGVRLKSTHLGQTVNFSGLSIVNQQSQDYHWELIFNPVVAGTFNYSDKTNSAVQVATGTTANTLTGGHAIEGGVVKSGSTTGAIQLRLETARRLGAAIDGTVDELVLAVMPLSNNADIEACLSWREPG